VLKDAPFAQVAEVIAHADWVVLIAGSVPAYVLIVWLRALRWRELAAPIRSYDSGAMFRAA